MSLDKGTQESMHPTHTSYDDTTGSKPILKILISLITNKNRDCLHNYATKQGAQGTSGNLKVNVLLLWGL